MQISKNAPKLMTREKLVNDSIKSCVNDIVYDIMENVKRQEVPANRVITECEIIDKGLRNEVWIKSNCDGWCEDVKLLFSYYPDELSFVAGEFINRTEQQAIELYLKRDVAYLRS